MGILTVRNLDPNVQARLRERAARNGRSMEAEARALITAAVAEDIEPINLAERIRHHFSGVEIALEVPDRSLVTQREVELPE